MKQQINIIFVRHGESCLNITYNLYTNNYLSFDVSKLLMKNFQDPTLSDIGKSNSIKKGKEMTEWLKQFNINKFDIIGCSPSIRTIETAHYMNDNQQKINIYPFLRETSIQRGYQYDLSPREVQKMHPIKEITEQKKYFKEEGILDRINFKEIDENLRTHPGNISKFIKWFLKNVNLPKKDIVNIFIATHAHVIANFFDYPCKNNNGILLNIVLDKTPTLRLYDTKTFKSSPSPIQFQCPARRCPGICFNKWISDLPYIRDGFPVHHFPLEYENICKNLSPNNSYKTIYKFLSFSLNEFQKFYQDNIIQYKNDNSFIVKYNNITQWNKHIEDSFSLLNYNDNDIILIISTNIESLNTYCFINDYIYILLKPSAFNCTIIYKNF
jgi:bisphosphoglycerate-dependent phosphoglycerate mutase